MKYLKKYSLCFFCFSFFCKHVSDVVHVFSYWNVRFVRPYYKKVKEKQHSKLRLQRNQRLGRSGINNFLLQNQKVSENVNMIKLGLVWEKKLCHHNYFINTMENSNLGAPSSTSICNLTPYTWNCQHMHVHLVRTYKVFQCLRHYFINFILIVRHKSNMLMLGVIL